MKQEVFQTDDVCFSLPLSPASSIFAFVPLRPGNTWRNTARSLGGSQHVLRHSRFPSNICRVHDMARSPASRTCGTVKPDPSNIPTHSTTQPDLFRHYFLLFAQSPHSAAGNSIKRGAAAAASLLVSRVSHSQRLRPQSHSIIVD